MMWTDTQIEELKRLWHDGYSASIIAAAFGNRTRNAVIGKVHRLELSSDGHLGGGNHSGGSKRKYDHDAILDRWASGETTSQIAGAVGCSEGGVSKIVYAARQAGDTRAVKRHRGQLTSEDRAYILSVYAPRPTQAELAARLGVSQGTISLVIRAAARAA